MRRANVFILTLFLVGAAMAQPTLQGSLSGTLGPGTYNVIGNCSVEATYSLTIVPGTTLQFTGHFGMKVYGTLNAVGTATNKIRFIRQTETTACDWNGIRFQAGSSPNSILSYCELMGARYQIWPDVNGGAISATNVAVTISHCRINNCYSTAGGGIYITGAAANISYCIITNCTAGNGGAVMLVSANNSIVQGCVLARSSSTST